MHLQALVQSFAHSEYLCSWTTFISVRVAGAQAETAGAAGQQNALHILQTECNTLQEKLNVSDNVVRILTDGVLDLCRDLANQTTEAGVLHKKLETDIV